MLKAVSAQVMQNNTATGFAFQHDGVMGYTEDMGLIKYEQHLVKASATEGKGVMVCWARRLIRKCLLSW